MNNLHISNTTVTIKKAGGHNCASVDTSISTSASTKIQSKVKRVVLKTVRIIDFHIYDEKPEKEESSGDENDDDDTVDYSKPYEAKVDEAQFVIQMFGLNETGETYSIIVRDFKPFFFIKVGSSWTQSTVNALLCEMKQKIGKYYENSIESAKLVEYNKLYGFSAGKLDKFAQFTFKNTATMNKMKNLWYEYTDTGRKPKPYVYNRINLVLYESSIPPLLRFLHINNISPSGWVSIAISKSYKCTVKTTTCHYEYICDSQYIKPMPEKETRVPYKICSFDIEASSSHGDFPIPKKSYKKLSQNIIDYVINKTTINNNFLKKIILSSFGYENKM
jgi:hypothetical protein